MPDLIFLSYARRDSGEFTLGLAKDLKNAGLMVWIDQLDIAAGDLWDRSVEDALLKAGQIVVVLSPTAVASENVLDEIGYSLDREKSVVPVLYRPCEIPLRLRRLQYIDFTGEYRPALEKLIERLRDSPRDQEETSEPIVRTVLTHELPDRLRLIERLGDAAAAELFKSLQRSARELAEEHGGRLIDSGDPALLLFERPTQAVRYALDLHRHLAERSQADGPELEARVGIHLGEVLLRRNPAATVETGGRPFEVDGLAKELARRCMSLACGRQTLLTQSAADLARRDPQGEGAGAVGWLAHGAYELTGIDEPVRIYEVGVRHLAPMTAPPDSGQARRLVRQETVLGWRPSPGQALPGRPHWVIDRKLGEGGFGEVWRASHRKTGDRRVFKFCYDAERLRSLKREITLFRLLKEELGDRHDITRIVDWNFERAPYFIESEYATEGNLVDWVEARGGFDEVPLATRLEILAQVSEALAAAHSVGVLHTDVKPANILVDRRPDGRPQAQLTDFGVGKVTDRGRLDQAGITVLGMTEPADPSGSSGTGTRLYAAPEVLEGKTPSLQADIYALGVILYQLVVGDFRRVLATGWRRDVRDPLLAEDIAYAVDGSPRRRLGNAVRLAERLRSLEKRRQKRQAEKRRRAEAAELAQAVRKARQRLLAGAVVMVFVTIVAAVRLIEARRTAREAATARQVSEFLVELFEVADPFAIAAGGYRGPEVTARELLERGAERMETELADQPEVRSRLLRTIGAAYLGLGLYDEARQRLDAALAAQRKLHDARHPDLADTLTTRGELLSIQGEYEAGHQDLSEAVEIRRHLLGDDAPAVAEIRTLLGEVSTVLARYSAAEEHLLEAVRIRRKADNPAAAVSLVALADLYQLTHRLEEAQTAYGEALDIARRSWGSEHPHAATALTGLGLVAHRQGEFEDAGRLYREALDIRLRRLGEDHFHVDVSRNNLAALLVSHGDPKAAEPLFRQSLDVRQRRLPENHPEVARSWNNLAMSLREVGRYRDAEPLFRQALEIWRGHWGELHPLVLATRVNLAVTLRELGELEDGQELVTRTLELWQQREETSPPSLAQTHHALAILDHAQGRHRAAERNYRQALDIALAALPERHPLIASVKVDLGRLLVERGDPQQALELLQDAVEVRRARYVAGAWRTAEAESLLGGCLTALGRHEEAEPLVLEGFQQVLAGLGPDDRRTAEALERIAELYRAWGRPEKLDEWQRRVQPAGRNDA